MWASSIMLGGGGGELPLDLGTTAELRVCEAREIIIGLLEGKIAVGHDIKHDFKAIQHTHPLADAASYPKLRQRAKVPLNQTTCFKKLTKELLGKEIQQSTRTLQLRRP